jgi:putative nucleotidyltransferase with HDIG domain
MVSKRKAERAEQGAGDLYSRLREDPEVREYIRLSDEAMAAIGYTEHGLRHVTQVAKSAGKILATLGHPEEEVELARAAGLLHDIGNVIARDNHEQSGALLAHPIVLRLGFTPRQAGMVMGAVGSHEQIGFPPISAINAAVTIGDKADVHRSRVRDYHEELEDIHDDVNYACVESELTVDGEESVITLELKIDTEIASVMEYFQIFTERMMMSREAASYLGCEFHLIINGTKLS